MNPMATDQESKAPALFEPTAFEPLLPRPVGFALRRARAEYRRGRHAQALSYLVDVGEVFIQLYTSIAIACLIEHEELATRHFKADLAAFLKKPPGIGTWLGCWRKVAQCLMDGGARGDFADLAMFPAVGEYEGRSVLSELLNLPAFRNRTKHTRTLPDDRALEVLALGWPQIKELLRQAWPLFATYVLCVVEEQDETELILREVTALEEETDALDHVVSVPRPADAGTLVLVKRADLERESEADVELLALGPMLMWHEGEVYIFGKGKNRRSEFVSTSGRELILGMDELEGALEGLLPDEPLHKHGAWVSKLKEHALVGRSLYEARDCTPESFYLGNPVSWPDLAQNLDIRRDLQAGDTRLSPTEFDEQYLPALVERVLRCDCPLVLFRGPGGCGKTTQLLRTAFEIDRRFSDQAIVLHLRHSHELASAEVAMACAANQDKAIILAVDEAGPLALEIERRRNSYRTARRKVGFLCAERPNMWPDAAVGDVLEVSSALSRTEAKELLQRLGAHGMLGALEDLSEEEQIEALAERYDRQILVTLREATSGQRFDEIIRSEYARMPGDTARDLYLEAAVLHRCRLPLPEALAIALAGCEDRKGFRRKVWRGARGALVKDGPAGDKFYRTRHARIAEVLCESLPAARIAEEVEQIIAQYVVTHDVEARVPIFRLI